MHKIPPFITEEILQKNKNLSIVVDVSCDTSNPNNPVPIYKETTSFVKPCLRITSGENSVDVVAIDHLPSLVPYESSKEFADALIEHLLQFPTTPVWTRAEDLFKEKLVSVLKQ